MCFELHALRSSQPPTDPGHASIFRYDRSLSGFPKPGVDLTHRKITFDHGITSMRDPSEFVITWDICFYHLALTAKASLGCYDRMVARILHSPCPASSQTCATPSPPTATCNSKASSDYLSILWFNIPESLRTIDTVYPHFVRLHDTAHFLFAEHRQFVFYASPSRLTDLQPHIVRPPLHKLVLYSRTCNIIHVWPPSLTLTCCCLTAALPLQSISD